MRRLFFFYFSLLTPRELQAHNGVLTYKFRDFYHVLNIFHVYVIIRARLGSKVVSPSHVVLIIHVKHNDLVCFLTKIRKEKKI